MFTYLLILLFTLIGPLIGSFNRKVDFKAKWKFAIPAIIIVAIPFIVWDAIFTRKEVWGFNELYYLGVDIIGMPIEEWLFFLVIPFACLLIYETVYTVRKSASTHKVTFILTTLFGVLLCVFGILNIEKLYTSVVFLLGGSFLLLHGLVLKRDYFSNFLIALVIHLIPFFIVNGILTALPVVWYNDYENLGFRLGTVPIEDSIYSMVLLLGNVTFYEYFIRHKR